MHIAGSCWADSSDGAALQPDARGFARRRCVAYQIITITPNYLSNVGTCSLSAPQNSLGYLLQNRLVLAPTLFGDLGPRQVRIKYKYERLPFQPFHVDLRILESGPFQPNRNMKAGLLNPFTEARIKAFMQISPRAAHHRRPPEQLF